MMRARMARRRPLRSQRRSGARLVLGAILAACILILGSPTVSAAGSSSSKSKQRTSQRASESGFPTCQAQRGLAFSSGAVPMELNMALPVCGSFSHNTCCNTNNIMPVLRATRLAQVGDFSEACQRVFEAVMCFSCHPDVGTGSVKGMCVGLCDAFYSSCANEFFLAELNADPTPCQPDSLLCSQAKDFATSGTELCAAFGIQVDTDTSKCYNGAAPKSKGKADRAASARTRTSMRRPTAKEVWVELTKMLGIKYKTRRRIESFVENSWVYVVGVVVIGLATYLLFGGESTEKRYSHTLGYEGAGSRVEGDIGELFLAARARRLGTTTDGSVNPLDSDGEEEDGEDEDNEAKRAMYSGIEVVGAGDRKGARASVVVAAGQEESAVNASSSSQGSTPSEPASASSLSSSS